MSKLFDVPQYVQIKEEDGHLLFVFNKDFKVIVNCHNDEIPFFIVKGKKYTTNLTGQTTISSNILFLSSLAKVIKEFLLPIVIPEHKQFVLNQIDVVHEFLKNNESPYYLHGYSLYKDLMFLDFNVLLFNQSFYSISYHTNQSLDNDNFLLYLKDKGECINELSVIYQKIDELTYDKLNNIFFNPKSFMEYIYNNWNDIFDKKLPEDKETSFERNLLQLI